MSCFALPSSLDHLDLDLPVAFLSPSGGEFLLIMLALILLFGAKDAPQIFRKLHNALDKMQRAAASFRYQIMYSDTEPHDEEEDTPDTLYDTYTDDQEEEESSTPTAQSSGSDREKPNPAEPSKTDHSELNP